MSKVHMSSISVNFAGPLSVRNAVCLVFLSTLAEAFVSFGAQRTGPRPVPGLGQTRESYMSFAVALSGHPSTSNRKISRSLWSFGQ